LVLLLCASTLDAQIIRRPARSAEPPAWVGLGIGLTQGFDVADGSTGSTWNFGSSVQYRASLEKRVQGGATIGVSANFASVPLTYTGGGVSGCPAGCDASANLTQVLGLFRAGGGLGFHQVIELAGGATAYSNFHAQSGGAKLPPTGSDIDATFAFGYGFGFGFSPGTEIAVTQEFSTAVHQRTGLSASENNLPRIYTTRFGLRVGLGQ